MFCARPQHRDSVIVLVQWHSNIQVNISVHSVTLSCNTYVYLLLQDKVTEWTEMLTCCCRIRWLSGLRCLPVVAGKGDWVDWDVYLFLQDKVTEWTDVYLLLQDKVTEWTDMVTCCCRIRWLSELRCVPVVAG
jgi:hypothetical protein